MMRRNFLLLCLCLIIICCPSLSVAKTNKIRVAIFLDKGSRPRPQIFITLSKDSSIEPAVVTGEDIREGCLRDFDVVFFPGGAGKKEAYSLGDGAYNVCQFVKNGGIYIGVCAGCYLAGCSRQQYLGLMPVTTIDGKHWCRGKAILPIEFTEKGMEVFGVSQPCADVIYHNGPVMRVFNEYKKDVIPLCYYRGEKVGRGGKVGVMTDTPAMVLYHYYNGMVLGISPHPEATRGLTKIELNAIHWLCDHRSQKVANN